LTEAEKKIESILYQLPNLPSAKVPKGKTPEDNVVVREGGKKPELFKGAVPHWDLAKKYNLIDFELGTRSREVDFRSISTKERSCSGPH
jgi:seryl-tRNA synthetase